MKATKLSQSTGLPSNPTQKHGLLVRIYPLDGVSPPLELNETSYLIGRDLTSSIALDDEAVSRRHALIEQVGQDYYLRDLDSTNGTFLNESKITSKKLESGDRIRFGKQIFKFVAGSEIESQYHEVMFNLVVSDGLTQVPNKRFFLEIYEREFDAMFRRRDSLVMMVMDLDKFKSINDTYGHLAGDAVLVEFARRTKTVLRSGEFFARFGGEEFVLMCSGVDVQEACIAAERIRSTIAGQPVSFEGLQIPVTVSIGLAIVSYDNATTKQELIERADQALYQAKQNGRNQVQVFSN